jgi:hypothetical protein
MAIRYCGSVKIDCKLVPALGRPHGESYKCNISIGGKNIGTQYVGMPIYLNESTDSAEAYDSAAHAALSFASDEEERGEKDWGGISDKCDYTDSGYAIRRSADRSESHRRRRS